MRTRMKTLCLTALLVTGLGATSVLYAHDSDSSDRSMMGRGGMMDMMRGKGGMNGMMRGKGGMMEGCPMMSGGQHTPKPNEQWREKSPATPKQGS